MEDKLQTLMQSKDEMVIYQTEDGTIKLDVLFDNDTVWLNADQMGQLFGKSKSTISEHLKNVFEEGELQRDSVVRNFRTTASDGKNYDVVYVGCVADRTSDEGFKDRLKEHNGERSGILFFDYEVKNTPLQAYNQECQDYYDWQPIYNSVHPAKLPCRNDRCPVCGQ